MKYSSLIFVFFLVAFSKAQVFAAENYLGISNGSLRNGNVHIDDIPLAIKSVIDFLMGIAGTISIIFIIIWAYQILFWSLEQDKTKGKETIISALWGFALAALSWLIIKTIISNLS